MASLAEGPTRDTPVEASDEAADQAADDSLGHANVVQETAGATEASVQPSKAGELAAPADAANDVHVFKGEWDAEGVWLYQAFNDAIADWAVDHQQLGGPQFNPLRMTWVKPSFAWVLYRSGYARKHNQTRILGLKVPHAQLAELLSRCACKHGGGGSKGRVQWDPARDLMTSEGREPRRMLRERAIQIGLSRDLSERYVGSVLQIRDVTDLAHRVGDAHAAKDVKAAMAALLRELPYERAYLPHCEYDTLVRLGMRRQEVDESGGRAHAAPGGKKSASGRRGGR